MGQNSLILSSKTAFKQENTLLVDFFFSVKQYLQHESEISELDKKLFWVRQLGEGAATSVSEISASIFTSYGSQVKIFFLLISSSCKLSQKTYSSTHTGICCDLTHAGKKLFEFSEFSVLQLGSNKFAYEFHDHFITTKSLQKAALPWQSIGSIASFCHYDQLQKHSFLFTSHPQCRTKHSGRADISKLWIPHQWMVHINSLKFHK